MLLRALKTGDIILEPEENIDSTDNMPIKHAFVYTKVDNKPYCLEAKFHCREVPLLLKPGTYIVLRPSWSDKEKEKGINWGRSQTHWWFTLGRFYACRSFIKNIWNILCPSCLKLKKIDGCVNCSYFVGEIIKYGEYPFITERTAKLTSWDYLTPEILFQCPIVGRIEVLY